MIATAIRLGESLVDLQAAVQKSLKNERTRKIYLDVLPVLFHYLTNRTRTYISPISDAWGYNAGRGLNIPVRPVCLIGTGSTAVLPHLSLWRGREMTAARMRLFATTFSNVVSQEPDYETAEIEFVDLSAKNSKSPREVRVTPFRDIQLLTPAELREQLELLHAGILLAERVIATRETSTRKSHRSNDDPRLSDDRQSSLL
jgi:hypothetical protein